MFNNDQTWTFFLAAIPGVLIALLSHWLDVRHQNQVTRQASQNGRKLLGLEIASNRGALAAFWQEINNLDKEKVAKDTAGHLEAMAQGGLLTYALPVWSSARWLHAQPDWLTTLNSKDVEQVDGFYRDLQLVTDLHTRLVTMTPQEQKYLDDNARFWPNRYAGLRDLIFDRLTIAVNHALSPSNTPQL